MTDLNDRKALLAIDKNNAIGSIEQLPQQIQQAWDEVNQLSLPKEYKDVDNAIVCGMGASWLGGHIMQGLLADDLKIPLSVCHDYHLPQWVNEKTLVIASSYSGTTEETVSALHEAYEKKAKILTISTGGDLANFAKEFDLPNYTFTGKYNPAKSPRLGLGYSILAQMVFLSKLGFITLRKDDVLETVKSLTTRVMDLTVESTKSEAKTFARNYIGVMPIVVAGTFLLGNAHAFSNQFNETAKTFGTFMHIPELNHHLMEGLANPKEVNKLKFLFLESNLYDERVRKRFQVTHEVVEKNRISYQSYKPHGTTKLAQSFDTLLFGSFTTYYLAMLYGLDPAPNPWVDYFKKRLKEI